MTLFLRRIAGLGLLLGWGMLTGIAWLITTRGVDVWVIACLLSLVPWWVGGRLAFKGGAAAPRTAAILAGSGLLLAIWSGATAWLAAQATGAWALPILGALAGLGASGFGTKLLLGPIRLPKLKLGPQPKPTFAEEVIAEAGACLTRFETALARLRSPDLRRRGRALHRAGADLVAEVANEPGRLSEVRRLLTYYLPTAEELVRGVGTIEAASGPNPALAERVAQTFAGLEAQFEAHNKRLAARELDSLDVSLRLLDQELRARSADKTTGT